MPVRGRRGTVLLVIVAAVITLLAMLFLMMNDINQVLRGVGQPAPEDLLQQETGDGRPGTLNRP